MWTSVALAAFFSMSLGQVPALTLSNARLTYGELGAIRPDNKYLPGDIFFVAFDVDGITVDEKGTVKYSMEMEVVNKNNQAIFKQQAQDREDFLPLGGTRMPARAFITIGFDQEPGVYTCKVKFTDRSSKATQTLEQKFEVLPKNFGIVQVLTTADRDAKIPAPALGLAGQSVFVHFSMVGFDRDPIKKQPDIEVEMKVVDASGKPTLAKPITYPINSGVMENDPGTPLLFLLPMNRVGDFSIELSAVDKISKKTSKISVPIKVLAVTK